MRNENVEDKYKNLLKHELYFFANVEEIKIDSVRWENLHWQKNNQTYQLLINLCQMILLGMIFTTSDGELLLKSNQIVDAQKSTLDSELQPRLWSANRMQRHVAFIPKP